MGFKSPGGDLVWLTPLMVFFGALGAYQSQRVGATGFAIMYGSIALCSLLVWFDQHWAAIPLMLYFLLAIAGGIALQIINGFSWVMAAKLVLAAYTVHAFWQWRKKQ